LGHLSKCSQGPQRTVRIQKHREDAYQHARTEIRKSGVFRTYDTQQAQQRRARYGTATVPDRRTRYLDAMGHLLDANTREEFHQRIASPVLPAIHRLAVQDPQTQAKVEAAVSASASVGGLLKFIIQGFSYRFVSAQDYLDTYDPPAGQPGRNVDLMVANLVDYDWPLAGGCGTKSPLRDQISLMERLSVYMGGRVHAMVPYDPMRQVAIAAGFHPLTPCGHSDRGSELTFDEITDAVMTRGFIGIKLYLPMGFLPLGNSKEPASTWAQPWLPAWMRQPIHYSSDNSTASFGERLDQELTRLYQWAQNNDVPITAHAEASQGPSLSFDAFAVATQWADVLQDFPALRINFAHLGDFTSNLPNTALMPAAATGLISYFGATKTSRGALAFGDLSYATGGLANPQPLAQLLRTCFSAPLANGAQLYDHLIYGSDWLMLLQESNVDLYFKVFQNALQSVDQALPQSPPISDRFFALNTARWIGLFRGQPTRTRLEGFYRKSGIARFPDWMAKLDSMPS
jgi:predicted TIM-barrel fold metal-dependent hydrolase